MGNPILEKVYEERWLPPAPSGVEYRVKSGLSQAAFVASIGSIPSLSFRRRGDTAPLTGKEIAEQAAVSGRQAAQLVTGMRLGDLVVEGPALNLGELDLPSDDVTYILENVNSPFRRDNGAGAGNESGSGEHGTVCAA